MRKRKIGEILIDNGLITKAMLEEALGYQAKFGGNITQYLIAYDYLKEEDLAKCVSIQFGYPYLPLRAYDISPIIIRLVPSHVAEKYLLMPVDKIENIITLVMADPFDEDAIKEVEAITRCKVQPFVGIISDIIKSIEKYYGIHVEYTELKKDRKAPLFIIHDNYVGIERRKSIRIKANIEIHFPLQDEYRKAKTKNISMNGFLFESNNMLPIGSFLSMQIDVPKEISPYNIVGVVQVVRAVPLDNGRFDIGVKIVNMAREDLDKVIKYALTISKHD